MTKFFYPKTLENKEINIVMLKNGAGVKDYEKRKMKKVYKEKGVRLYLAPKQQRKLICLLYKRQQELVSIGGNTQEEFENKVEEYDFVKVMLAKLTRKGEIENE